MTESSVSRARPYEIGFAAGRALGAKIEETINHYIASLENSSDMEKLHAGALPWLRGLPQRFQEECEGIAEGQTFRCNALRNGRILKNARRNKCSSAVYLFRKSGSLRLHAIMTPMCQSYGAMQPSGQLTGTLQRSASLCRGMSLRQLASTGKDYGYTPTFCPSRISLLRVSHTSLVTCFLTEALELCRNLNDVEAFLNATDRDGGMLLFAVDGKTNRAVLFDCMCSKHYQRELTNGWLVGTNHYCACKDETLTDDESSVSTVDRFRRDGRSPSGIIRCTDSREFAR